MAAKPTAQQELEKVRKPRVHIVYEVEEGGAIRKKEIPFVMGVLGDFSGQPEEGALGDYKERKFIDVVPGKFDDLLKSQKPRLEIAVKNKLTDEGGKIGVELNFEKLDDFSPEGVAKQVGPLRELVELRTALSDLRGKILGNEKLDKLLRATLDDESRLKQLADEIKAQEPAESDEEETDG